MSHHNEPPTIAISGASAGIGLAIAERFAHEGWRISIAARKVDDLNALHKRWEHEFPDSRLHTIGLDLGDAAASQTWAASLAEFSSKLDVLVHNLGKFESGTLLQGAEDQLATLMATNLFSAHHLTRAMLPFLIRSSSAQMITIGSVSTTDWPADLAAYSLSKYAMEGWHRQISKELARHRIRTTLLRPGATYTRSWTGIEVDPSTLLQPEQVAASVGRAVFQATDEHLEELTIRPSRLPK